MNLFGLKHHKQIYLNQVYTVKGIEESIQKYLKIIIEIFEKDEQLKKMKIKLSINITNHNKKEGS